VLGALENAEKPMGAYELLEALNNSGLRSPPQVYRALDQLIEEGSVHKIESISAYALCSDAHCGVERNSVFAICTRCGQATELHEPALDDLLANLTGRQGFRMNAATVELSGLCEKCADA
jgi:Fur family zinc uptake transcriptional regulator